MGGIKEHQCKICDKKFGRSETLKSHVKEVHVHDGVDQGQSLKRKKQVDNALKRSKNVKNSKRMKIIEKQALDISNIVGFDHENEIAGKEQKIKQEIKQEVKTESLEENITGFDHIGEQKTTKKINTEVFDFNFDIKDEPIDQNVDEEIEQEALDVSKIMEFDYENQTIYKEPKIKQEIKQEVKIEPMGENFN